MGADGIAVAVRRYRIMAYVTGVVLIFLCFVGIPLQVFAHSSVVANDVGTAHGILYLIYLAAAYLMTRRVGMKLASPQTVLVLLAGTIPVLTFVVERWVTRRYINPALSAAKGRAGGKGQAGGKGRAGGLMTAREVPAQDPVPRPPVQRSG